MKYLVLALTALTFLAIMLSGCDRGTPDDAARFRHDVAFTWGEEGEATTCMAEEIVRIVPHSVWQEMWKIDDYIAVMDSYRWSDDTVLKIRVRGAMTRDEITKKWTLFRQNLPDDQWNQASIKCKFGVIQ